MRISEKVSNVLNRAFTEEPAANDETAAEDEFDLQRLAELSVEYGKGFIRLLTSCSNGIS